MRGLFWDHLEEAHTEAGTPLSRGPVFPSGLKKEDAPSYFIECLLYNVPDSFFTGQLATTYTGIIGWPKTAKLKEFKCQNG